MNITLQMQEVYQRASQLQQDALDSPVQQVLLEKALLELNFVLEELQTSQDELEQQNQTLLSTQHLVELERQPYQTLFEFAPSGYLVTDLQAKILEANHYAASILIGTSKDYLINKPLLIYIHEPDRSRFLEQLATFPSGQRWEIMLNPRKGVLTSVAIAFTRIKDPQRNQDLILWAFHDITRRKQLGDQLQISHDHLEQRVADLTAELVQFKTQLLKEIQERQQAEQIIRDQAKLIDNATDAILVLDLEQRINFCSKGAERLYGWTLLDILGKPANVLFSEDNIVQLRTGVQQTLEQGSWQVELDQVSHSGKPIIVESRWNLVRDTTGAPQSILVVNTDITDKKQLETQFYRAQRIESLGTLASGIVHDLSNILTPILGLADLQLAHLEDSYEKNIEVSNLIRNCAQRGFDLVKQLKLFTQGKTVERVPCQVENLLQEVAQTIHRTFPQSIKIITDSPPHLVRLVVADPTQLLQVLMNLCVNARDAMPNGGTLRMGAENSCIAPIQALHHLEAHPGNYVMLRISDTGGGIPQAQIEKIYEPFFTTKPSSQGMGLGLSTVFRILRDHDGFIEVSSEEGKGSQFRVYLPAIAA